MVHNQRASAREKISSRLLIYLQFRSRKSYERREERRHSHLPRSSRGSLHHHAPQHAGIHDRLDLKARGSLAGGELGDTCDSASGSGTGKEKDAQEGGEERGRESEGETEQREKAREREGGGAGIEREREAGIDMEELKITTDTGRDGANNEKEKKNYYTGALDGNIRRTAGGSCSCIKE